MSTGNAGITMSVQSEEPLTFFDEFVAESLTDLTMTETNRYATQMTSHEGLSPFSHMHKWVQTTVAELMVYFSLLILMGIDQRPKISMYWSRDFLVNMLEESNACYTERTPNADTEIGKSRQQNVMDVEPDDDDDDDEQTMYRHTQSEQPNENNQQCESTLTADNDQEDQAVLDRHTTTRGNPLDSCFHINNIKSKTISIAPAEAETPLPIFLDNIFEEGCNPEKYPYGTGGLLRNTKQETETINVKTEPAVTGKCLDAFSAVKHSRMHGVS